MQRTNKQGMREDVREDKTPRQREVHFAHEKKGGTAAFRFTVPNTELELIHYMRELQRTKKLQPLLLNLLQNHYRIMKARLLARQDAEGVRDE